MSLVRYDVADHVATIALDQPEKRNALSDALLDDLIAAFERARDDDDVRAVVLDLHAREGLLRRRRPRGLLRRRPADPTSTSPPTASRACSS